MSSPSADEVFGIAVDESIREWKSFQLCLEHGMGGLYTQEKLVWLRDAIVEFFATNADLYADEVDDFVAEILDNEFDSHLEDGSTRVFATNLCRYYQFCRSGRHQEVYDRLQDVIRQRTSAQTNGGNSGVDNVNRVVVEEALESLDIASGGDSEQQMSGEDMDQEMGVEVEPEEEGWTRVDRKHRK